GVGKSLAYLVPAILFAVGQQKKAIVSTHTINLQEQLTEKDLPMLSDVLGSPKVCGFPSDFAKDHGVCFFQRARNKFLSSDVLVLNHTLFFTLLGGIDEEQEGGILFKNDFVIFDEAHQMEHVASRHIGLSVSSGQVRYALNRLWNPRTEKGLLATLRQGNAVKLVEEILSES